MWCYTGDLKYGLVWILNGQKRLCCKWSGFQMGSKIRKPDHLRSRQMAANLSRTIWNPNKNVQILNGLVFKWLVLGIYKNKKEGVKSWRVCILIVLVKMRAFNIWNTPNANWLQNSVRRKYCRNGRGWHSYPTHGIHSQRIHSTVGLCVHLFLAVWVAHPHKLTWNCSRDKIKFFSTTVGIWITN